ncbi:MAG: RDD family protein [Neisseria sp.]|uniref:RDD family protein n=1 Tax=Neisseria sp. TaxID=192066 RepID=UPI0026DB0BCA|nr:RDD family protein [Neisseria sp.]MDO4641541.1 RDD family protein [Neisseria sp.]
MPPLPAAPLKRRFAALLYEGLLAAAVTAVLCLPAGIASLLLNPVSILLSQIAVSLILLGGWWFYFKLNWLKQGQTLPMRTWRIGLTDPEGRRPHLSRLRLRFIWVCVFIIFIPLLAYAALHRLGLPPRTTFIAAILWWILPWGFAYLNTERQFLYDFLAGTRLVDLRDNKTNN